MAEGVQFMSLFSGAGGGVTGVKQAGYDVCCTVDNDESAVNTLRKNHEDVNVIEEDLSATSPKEFSSVYGIEVEDVDGVIGGPPCQGFSLSGKRDPHDERNELVTDFIEYVRFFQPKYVVMENVEGILSMLDGAVVDYVHEHLEECGYTVEHRTIDSADYGVPQRRKRVFFVAVDRDTVVWPEECAEAATVRDAFDSINDESEDHDFRTDHSESVTEKIRKTEPGEAIYDSFKKNQVLEMDEPSPTLLVSDGSWQYARPDESRSLTIHERALLQSFPPEYTFTGTIGERRRQTGNAVPPKMVEKIVSSVVEF